MRADAKRQPEVTWHADSQDWSGSAPRVSWAEGEGAGKRSGEHPAALLFPNSIWVSARLRQAGPRKRSIVACGAVSSLLRPPAAGSGLPLKHQQGKLQVNYWHPKTVLQTAEV